MDPVTTTPRKGTLEVWEVINLTLTDDDHHLLHVHLAVFAVLEQRSLQADDDHLLHVQLAVFAVLALAAARGRVLGRMRRRNNAHVWGSTTTWPAGGGTSCRGRSAGGRTSSRCGPARCRILVRFKLLTDAASPEESRFPFDVTTTPGYVYHRCTAPASAVCIHPSLAASLRRFRLPSFSVGHG
jgi:hypothetical protein